MIESSVCTYAKGNAAPSRLLNTPRELYSAMVAAASSLFLTIGGPVGGHQLALVHIYIPEGKPMISIHQANTSLENPAPTPSTALDSIHYAPRSPNKHWRPLFSIDKTTTPRRSLSPALV